MAINPEGTLMGFLRSRFVLAGLLVLGVGMADMIAGRGKLEEYQAIVAAAPVPVARTTATLFPSASEAEQEHQVAAAKLGFYQLLFLSGQVLSALGVVLLALGVLQLRLRGPRPRAEALPLR